MMLPRKPSRQRIQQFLEAQRGAGFSYAEVGASLRGAPNGYRRDEYGVRLGSGRGVFEAAKAALERWEMFNLGWVQLFPEAGPLKPGMTVAVLVHLFPFYFLNAGRVAYVVEEKGPGTCHSIGYGTLQDHAEMGEERFSIVWDRSDESVSYHVLAFSRPRLLLAWLGYPLTRLLQQRFARHSLHAMQRAVSIVE